MLCFVLSCVSVQADNTSLKNYDMQDMSDKNPLPQKDDKEDEKDKKDDPDVPIGIRHPSWSPDDKFIAFSLHGDIWIVPSEGGLCKRITLHKAEDLKPVWSPDGKKIAFNSLRDGVWNVYITEPDGGLPTQLTFHSSGNWFNCWTPDGKNIIFSSGRSGEGHPWIIPAAGGLPKIYKKISGVNYTISPDGKNIAYAIGSYRREVLGYEGSGNWRVATIPVIGGEPKVLTSENNNNFYPAWTKDGQHIYFVKDENKIFNIYKVSMKDGKHEKITDFKEGVVRQIQLSPDGKEFIFEYNFELWKYSIPKKKAERVNLVIKSDETGDDTVNRVVTSGAESPSTSPDGSRIVVSINGNLWIMPVDGGRAYRITSGTSHDAGPKWSPNGKYIAFYSNRSGNSDLWLINTNGTGLKQITKHPKNDFFLNWSPDSKYIVFCSERTGNRDIFKVAIDGSMPDQVTKSNDVDDDPSVSPDGQWIYFDSSRGGNSDIWKISVKGGEAIRVSGTPHYDQSPMASPDGNFIVYSVSHSGLWICKSSGGPSMQVSPQGDHPVWSINGQEIIYSHNGNIYRISAPKEILTGKMIPFVAELKIDKKKEIVQVFEEAWTKLKEGFYDPKFHGNDWEEIRKKYRPLIEKSETKDEMYTLISHMLGELSASHLGIYGPYTPPKNIYGVTGMTLLPHDGKGLIVDEVVPNSPADKAWIRKGDIVLQINNKEIKPDENYFKYLNGTVKKKIILEVTPASDNSKLRKVELVPIDLGQLYQLKYKNWVDDRRKIIDEKTNNQVGYIHLSNMMPPALEQFKKEIVEVKDKKALILDVRNNSGGRIHDDVLEILQRKIHSTIKPRDKEEYQSPNLVWGKPVVLLINQKSFSDAEVFAHAFKTLGLGTVIGVPTAGGVIGTINITLSDGSTFRIPRIGWFTKEGKNLENHGVEPDILVEESLKDIVSDNDIQLEKAIELILKSVKIEKEKDSGR